MKRLFILLFACFSALTTFAQMQAPTPKVFLMVADSAWAMTPNTTLSQLRKGWDIQGINVGRKLIRYLWGIHARQQVDGRTPTFLICPDTENLNDYALLSLKVKRDHRRFPSAALSECPYKRIEPTDFEIQPVGDTGFRVRPHESLEPGEYLLVDLRQKPVNEFGDVIVYDFSIR